jgi:DNA-binding transcriptional LysR family regulator
VNLRHLEVFCAVVGCESFSGAAEQLIMTQPAVSMQVQMVESHFGGIQLLERRTRRVVLPEAGEAVYRWAREVLRTEGETRREVDEFRHAEAGRVVIGASMTVGSYVLPRILNGFKREHPRAEIVLRLGERDEIGTDILSGAIDCGVMIARQIPPGLEAEGLGSEDMVLIGPADHPLAGLDEVSVQDLANEPFITAPRGSTFRRIMDELLAQKGFGEVNVLMEVDNTEGVKRGVQQGLGFALQLRTGVQWELEHGVLAEIHLPPPPFTVELGLVRRPRQRLSPIIEELITYLRKQLHEHLSRSAREPDVVELAPRTVVGPRKRHTGRGSPAGSVSSSRSDLTP